MENPLGNLLHAIAFFTRIPVPERFAGHMDEDAGLTDAVVFFPVAGFLVGLSAGLVWWISGHFFPAMVSAGLAVAAGMVLTGALHEDGLADCADGLGATGDRKKALEIMRDSRMGAYGTLALILSVGLRWAALTGLALYGGVAALIIAHTVSRAAIIIAMYSSVYARPEGLGMRAEGTVSEADLAIAFAVTLVLALVFGGWAALPAAAGGLVLSWLFLQYLIHRIGGFTGDGLGAMQQICEIVVLVILAGFWT